jgi:hypothetical protein
MSGSGFRASVVGLLAAVAALVAPAGAEEARQTLGVGRLFTNDYLGDGEDRWRTGSYSLSVLRGPQLTSGLPDRPGQVLEYRFRSEIIAPGRLNGAGSDDRPYVGMLAFGVHSHHRLGPGDYSLGVDLVAVGPQTGVGDWHAWLHGEIGAPRVGVLEEQIGDNLSYLATGQYAAQVALTGNADLRPFVEVQTGVEDLVRLGADLVIGPATEAFLLRDNPTGQLYPGLAGGAGLSFLAGVDWARVHGSDWLPAAGGYRAEEERFRARAGLHWQSEGNSALFYGLTWLSPEFVGQPEGQVLGSVTLRILF